MAFAHGEEQRREARLELCAEIGTAIDEGTHYCPAALGCGPHDGRLIAPLPSIGVSLMGEQGFHGFEVSRARRRHQDGLAALKRCVRVGAGVEQELHEGRVSVCTGEEERRHAVATCSVDVRARFYQQACRIHVVVVDRPMEGGRPIGLGRVDVRASIQRIAP